MNIRRQTVDPLRNSGLGENSNEGVRRMASFYFANQRNWTPALHPTYVWSSDEPRVLGENELLQMREIANDNTKTRPSFSHPPRPMTGEEREQWIYEYLYTGGKNRQEIETFIYLNRLRELHNLEPFKLNYNLSMAARLYSQLDFEFNKPLMHLDMFYGAPQHRVNFITGYDIYPEYCRYTRKGLVTEVVRGGFGSGFQPIRSFYNSPGHRAAMLDPDLTHAGVGMAYVGMIVIKFY